MNIIDLQMFIKKNFIIKYKKESPGIKYISISDTGPFSFSVPIYNTDERKDQVLF